MLKKILISEDFDTYNIGIKKTVEELQIPIADQVFYCDDALLKIQRAILDKEPYELLITDLSFTSDHRNQILKGGEELIEAVKKEQPTLKIIILSIENRFSKIKSIFNKYGIEAFITKGRDDAKELKRAIMTISENKPYINNNDKNYFQGNIYEFTEYDITLLKLLSQGSTQKEVEYYLKEKQITPNSESSIEKKLAILRQSFGARDTKHLLSIALELGVI